MLSFAQPVPEFTATPLSGCAPIIVNFQDLSTGGAVEWDWDLGNGTLSNLQNPSTSYLTSGNYTVRLTVKNAAGMSATLVKNQFITVFARPTIDFTATPLSGCFPLPVTFTDASTAGSGTISSWLWDFGDGTTSSNQSPVHIFTGAGSFNISLTITNSNGCSKTFTKPNYVVITGVTAAFTNTVPSGCTVPQTVTFTNQSTGSGPLTFQWSFGDGGTSSVPSPTYTYNTAGQYNVQLIVTGAGGCKDTVTSATPINVGAVNADFTVPSPLCAGTAFTFTNTSSPAPLSVMWTFGDGTFSTIVNPVKVYAGAATYNVKLVSDFGGCKDSITKSITILAKPISQFTATPRSSCILPLNVNFTFTGSGAASYQWIFGDGTTSSVPNPMHTYTSSGLYTVTLITTNAQGCTDTLIKTDYIKLIPAKAIINNLPRSGCAPFTYTFSATDTLYTTVSYLWEFGDGTTSTLPNPTHTFPLGVYNIVLTITTAEGCTATDTVFQGIRASVKPMTSFSATPRDACAFTSIQFTDLTPPPVNGWLWLFGDGGQSTQQNPSYQYGDTGLFTVTLITSNFGCSDTLRFPNYIHIKPPIARFIVAPDCINKYRKVFTDQSIGADEWLWDFGDGSTSTLQNPVHTYAATGTYSVTLTVKNLSTGCTFPVTQTYIVADEPAMFNSPAEVCKNTPAIFTATSLNNPPAVMAYVWDFGDGMVGAGNTITHTYTLAGVYTVRLVVTDVNGCKDTLPRSIRVNGPTADFNIPAPGACVMNTVTFTNLSTTDGIHAITEWHWYYGDGTDELLTSPPFQHIYNSPGVYNIALVVTDNFGCRDSIIRLNYLTISAPDAQFVSTDTLSCPNKPIVFTNTSTGPGLTYFWDFGDGTTGTQPSPTHMYTADGIYTVLLRVTDQYGCISTLTKSQYIIIASPTANFTLSGAQSTCPPLFAQFTNTSQNFASLSWDFGDGNTSSIPNPFHQYNFAGVYIAKLTVVSPGGCTSQKTQEIRISGPSGTFSYSPLNGCSPLTVNFIANTQSRSSFIWDFDDGTTLPTTDSVLSYTYNFPGIYTPKMILKDAQGCTVPIQGPQQIIVRGVVASFTVDTMLRCSPGIVSFTNTSVASEAITSYNWDFGDGTSSTLASPTHIYAAEGLYFPKLTVTTQSGCSHQKTSLLPIRVVKTPDVSVTRSPDGCAPITMNFSGNLLNGDTSAIMWQWRFSDGRMFTGQTLPPVLFTTAGTYTDTLIAINSSGCRDTAVNSLEVYAKPTVNAGVDMTNCQGTPQTLTAGGADNYVWSPATGLSCTTCPSPIATPDSTVTYSVIGTTTQGCKDTAAVKLTVNLPITLQPGLGDTLCRGESATLTVIGAATYVWSPALGLNITTGPKVIATPDTSTIYSVVGFDGKNCFTDTAYFTVIVNPLPTVSAGPDRTINVGQSVTLTPILSADVVKVIWSPMSNVVNSTPTSITVRPPMDIQYKVTVNTAAMCVASDLVNIYVVCNGANVFIPNTFSPNGDGANDVFYPRGSGLFNIKSVRIFNRWGEEIYAKYNLNPNDETSGWTGVYRGQKLPTDVYVYMIEVLCENNTTLLYKGNVTLLR